MTQSFIQGAIRAGTLERAMALYVHAVEDGVQAVLALTDESDVELRVAAQPVERALMDAVLTRLASAVRPAAERLDGVPLAAPCWDTEAGAWRQLWHPTQPDMPEVLRQRVPPRRFFEQQSTVLKRVRPTARPVLVAYAQRVAEPAPRYRGDD